MNDEQRQYYAMLFGSIARNVKTWDELTNQQRNQSDCMFFSNGPEWVYLVTNYGDSVLARRRYELRGAA